MNHQFKTILLDFDGTVINSAPGILNSFSVSFASLGLPQPRAEDLRWCIGPGAHEVVKRLFPDKDDLFRAEFLSRYRASYDGEGFRQTEIYPGMRELLMQLQTASYCVFLTTMKARSGAEKIIEMLNIRELFQGVHCFEPTEPVRFKHELIKRTIERESLSPERTIIVGDTQHDIIAGKKNNLHTIGVTYGFGSEQELISAGADYLCSSIDALRLFFLE